MRPYTYLLFPVFLCCWAACGPGGAPSGAGDETFRLVSKFSPGENYLVNIQRSEKISATDSTGNTQISENNTETTLHYTVLEVMPAHARLRLQYTAYRSGSFNSADTGTYADTMALRQYRTLAAASPQISIDTLGRILRVKGAQGLYSSGISNSPMDDNRILKEQLQNSLPLFPGIKLHKGDTWETSARLGYGYPGIYTHTYTLKDVQEGRATITVRSRVEPLPGAPPAFYPGGLVTRLELYGSLEGNFTIDLSNGRVQESELRLKLSGKSHGTLNGQAFENVLSAEINTRTKTKALENGK